MKPFILASKSPRRKELLEQIHLHFSIVTSEVEEKIDNTLTPEEQVVSLAMQKAEAVFKNHEDKIVLGADTIVVIDGKILGKPKDEAEAIEMLKQLSGRTHEVITGVVIRSKEKNISFYEKAEVTFFPLTEEEIMTYVQSKEPLDKAGAYGIQGLGATLVEKINGDYFTIVGLPIAKVYRALKQF